MCIMLCEIRCKLVCESIFHNVSSLLSVIFKRIFQVPDQNLIRWRFHYLMHIRASCLLLIDLLKKPATNYKYLPNLATIFFFQILKQLPTCSGTWITIRRFLLLISEASYHLYKFLIEHFLDRTKSLRENCGSERSKIKALFQNPTQKIVLSLWYKNS